VKRCIISTVILSGGLSTGTKRRRPKNRVHLTDDQLKKLTEAVQNLPPLAHEAAPVRRRSSVSEVGGLPAQMGWLGVPDAFSNRIRRPRSGASSFALCRRR
jgi:hypothetical protein